MGPRVSWKIISSCLWFRSIRALSDPETASRCAAFEPASVSGIKGYLRRTNPRPHGFKRAVCAAGRKTNHLDADERFVQAQSSEEAGGLLSAESLYRHVMKLDLNDPPPGLNLGNLLPDAWRTVEAEAAYQWDVAADPNSSPAWHKLH